MGGPLTNTMPITNGVQIYPYQYFGMVGVSPTVQQSSFIHVSALVNTLRISGYQSEASSLEALLRGRRDITALSQIRELVSRIPVGILEKNSLRVQNNAHSMFSEDPTKALKKILKISQRDVASEQKKKQKKSYKTRAGWNILDDEELIENIERKTIAFKNASLIEIRTDDNLVYQTAFSGYFTSNYKVTVLNIVYADNSQDLMVVGRVIMGISNNHIIVRNIDMFEDDDKNKGVGTAVIVFLLKQSIANGRHVTLENIQNTKFFKKVFEEEGIENAEAVLMNRSTIPLNEVDLSKEKSLRQINYSPELITTQPFENK